MLQLHADEHVEELHKLILEDAAQGWISEPVAASGAGPDVRAVLGRGVPQLKADGSAKVRAVFDYSWCVPEAGSRASRLPAKVAKARGHNGCT